MRRESSGVAPATAVVWLLWLVVLQREVGAGRGRRVTRSRIRGFVDDGSLQNP